MAITSDVTYNTLMLIIIYTLGTLIGIDYDKSGITGSNSWAVFKADTVPQCFSGDGLLWHSQGGGNKKKGSLSTPIGSISLVPIYLDMWAYTLEEHCFSFDLKLTKREVTGIATLKTTERIFFSLSTGDEKADEVNSPGDQMYMKGDSRLAAVAKGTERAG